ncbi:methyltransferase [Actinosynnema sp. NPDC020468]|uniref:methyltransferase n=1 Tax=Actinosynnema sp. NPDC020468 TaxID=3154488 RepID=UPI00340F171C
MTASGTRPRLDITAVLRLAELADLVVPYAIRVVCDLRVADHLVAGPLPGAELAERTGADPGALERVLRALAGKGIFTEVEPGTFALTPLAQPLRSDHPVSLRAAYPLLPADSRAWARFDHSVRTGESAFELVHGTDYWSYLTRNPGEAERFDGSQAAATRLELRAVLQGYDGWADLRTVVDVGGGNGAFLAGLLARLPGLSGTVLDLPHVVAGAGEVFDGLGVADRARAVGGSFFDGVPAGADAYLLKRVLYHWSDERALELLRAVRAGMRPDSRLLLLEPVVTPGDSAEVGRSYDLILLAMAGGGARSAEQIDALLTQAGLRRTRLVPTLVFPVVEAGPA